MQIETNDSKYCCNCDWLQFSVILAEKDPELECPIGYRLEILPGNNIFKNRAILWGESGEKYLTILWHPYSPKLKELLMTCQIDNHLLYAEAIMFSFKLLQQITPCVFNSMGRIDICLDFELNDYRWQVIRKLWIGDYYVQGKHEGSAFWHEAKSEAGRNVHCMSWGSKTSEIKVKLYNKSRELSVDEKGCGEKQYIIDGWKEVNFDLKKVWRLEFSISGSGQLTWDNQPITLQDVATSDWLMNVFFKLYEKRFIIRENQGRRDGHKNSDRIIIFLSLGVSNTRIKWREGAATTKVSAAEITLLRKFVVLLEERAALCSDDMFTIVANSILQLCERRHVKAYFGKMFGCSPEDYLQLRFDNIGLGKHEAIPDIKNML